jgi:hypothetical protein
MSLDLGNLDELFPDGGYTDEARQALVARGVPLMQWMQVAYYGDKEYLIRAQTPFGATDYKLLKEAGFKVINQWLNSGAGQFYIVSDTR